MVSSMREKLEKTAAKKENEIENIRGKISTTTINVRYTENSEKNISIIKETAKYWMEGIQTVEKELIQQEHKEAADEIMRDVLGVRNSEEAANKCLKALHDVKVKLRTCSDAALVQHESKISRKLAAIAIPSLPLSDQSLPIINMQRPTQRRYQGHFGDSESPTSAKDIGVQDRSRFLSTNAAR